MVSVKSHSREAKNSAMVPEIGAKVPREIGSVPLIEVPGFPAADSSSDWRIASSRFWNAVWELLPE